VNLPDEESAEDYAEKLGFNSSKIDISGRIESREEQDFRLKREQKEYDLKIWKDKVGYVIAAILITTLLGFSMLLFLLPNSVQDDKDLAKTILAAISSAVAGYLFGKNNSI
jgi:hypothetical protein